MKFRTEIPQAILIEIIINFSIEHRQYKIRGKKAEKIQDSFCKTSREDFFHLHQTNITQYSRQIKNVE